MSDVRSVVISVVVTSLRQRDNTPPVCSARHGASVPSMATHNVLARWVTPGGHPQRRLVFFPHAGAGGLTGRSLAADDAEVLAHRRPGREARMAEPAASSVEEAVQEAVEALLPTLDADDLPTDVLGHSFGALLGAEFVARMERDRPGRIRRLVVSAKVPPPDPSPELSEALRDDQALVAWLVDLGGTPPELLEDPVMRSMVLDPLRADLTASLGHDREPPLLNTPLLTVTADGDATAPAQDVDSWSRFTTAPVGTLRLHGGHHALFEQAELLHQALREPGSSPSAPER